MRLKISVDDHETLEELASLTPRQFMIAWTTAVRRELEKRAREKIGGDFGDEIARQSIQTDESDPTRHELYLGGEKGYIAEHVHTGGVIRPKNAKYLAIPIDKSVKGLFAREVPGLSFIRRKNEGPNGRAYLGKPLKKGFKPLFVLKRSVMQKPRPWWPDDMEVQGITVKFFEDNF